MLMKKKGLNVSRSKKAMYESFFKLIKNKDFSEISVQDIIDDCEYSRSCFYNNFEDKYNMLNILVQDEAKAFIDCCRNSLFEAQKNNSKKELYFKIGLSIFELVYAEKNFYEALILGKIPGHSKESLFKLVNDHFINIASYPVAKKYPNVNIELYASVLTAIISPYIEFWVKENFKHPPEYMEEQLMIFLSAASETDFVDV